MKLDGRPLRIELVGGAGPAGVTLSSGVTVSGMRGPGGGRSSMGGGARKVVVKVVPRPNGPKAKAKVAAAGAKGAKPEKGPKKKKGPKKEKTAPPTQESLDAALDSYKGAAAMEA